MLATLQAYPNLRLVEASVEDIQLSGYSDGEEPQHDRVTVTGVVTKEGGVIHANRVVITTGTFLRGNTVVTHTLIVRGCCLYTL